MKASLDTATLLRIALLVVVVLFVLWAVQLILELTFWFLFEVLPVLLAIAVIALVILWALDRF